MVKLEQLSQDETGTLYFSSGRKIDTYSGLDFCSLTGRIRTIVLQNPVVDAGKRIIEMAEGGILMFLKTNIILGLMHLSYLNLIVQHSMLEN